MCGLRDGGPPVTSTGTARRRPAPTTRSRYSLYRHAAAAVGWQCLPVNSRRGGRHAASMSHWHATTDRGRSLQAWNTILLSRFLAVQNNK